MPTKKQPGRSAEPPSPPETPDIISPVDPEDPVIQEEDPDIIRDEDEFETPPYEAPLPGEGP